MPTDDTELGSTPLHIEYAEMQRCEVRTLQNGLTHLQLSTHQLPSYPTLYFGLIVTLGDAEALAAQITKHWLALVTREPALVHGNSAESFPRIERANLRRCNVAFDAGSKRFALWLAGDPLPSHPTLTLGLLLSLETTREEAEALATQITQSCLALFSIEYDIELEVGIIHYPPDEYGRPKVDLEWLK